MSTALSGFSHARRGNDFAGKLIRAAHVHQVPLPALLRFEDLRQHGAQLQMDIGHLVGDGPDLRRFGGQRFVLLVQPFDPPTIHELDLFVAVDFEQPKPVSGEPIVIVAVKDNAVPRRDTCAADEFLERVLADNIPAHLVLELRLPVKTDRAGDVAGVVGLGVHVNLDEFDAGFAEVVLDPIGRDQHFGMRVVCHSFLSKLRFRSPDPEYASSCWRCI